MRGGVVGAGVLLMILGAILFFYYPVTNTAGSGANPFGDLFIGPILGFIGFILLIAGLAASPATAQTIVIQQATPRQAQPGWRNQAYGQVDLRNDGPTFPVGGHPAGIVTSPTNFARPGNKSPYSVPSDSIDYSPNRGGSGSPAGSPAHTHLFCPWCGSGRVEQAPFCSGCGRAFSN